MGIGVEEAELCPKPPHASSSEQAFGLQSLSFTQAVNCVTRNSLRTKSYAPLVAPLQESFGIRCLDVIGASLGLILTLPLLLVLALLIKLDSPGPIIYRQRRTGRDRRTMTRDRRRAQRASARERRRQEYYGRTFFIYKFRTMRHNAERRTGPVWTMPDDPRITKVGRWLRRFHLDELPQFANVLKGEMSLVGPRPERPEIIARLVQEVPEYCLRLLVKPGMTGLAQIFQGYDNTIADVKRKIHLDLFFATHFSTRLYVRILFLTVVKIFSATPVLEAEFVMPELGASTRQHKEQAHEKQ